MEENEFKTGTGGPSISGFTDTHIREYLKTCIKPEMMKRRRGDTRYGQMISLFWKYGIHTYLGSVKRELKPNDICPKLAILQKACEEKRLDNKDYAWFKNLIKHNSHSRNYRRTQGYSNFIPWDCVKWINSTSKKYEV